MVEMQADRHGLPTMEAALATSFRTPMSLLRVNWHSVLPP
jgi:hypothetical protein